MSDIYKACRYRAAAYTLYIQHSSVIINEIWQTIQRIYPYATQQPIPYMPDERNIMGTVPLHSPKIMRSPFVNCFGSIMGSRRSLNTPKGALGYFL